MLLSHKIRLYPNNHQATYLGKACGIARFAYNWGLAEWKRMYEDKKLNPSLPSPSRFLIDKKLNSVKLSLFPWMKEVTKCAPQYGTANLGEAFSRFFSKKANFPKFKKRGSTGSFGITNEQFETSGDRIRIPKLGWVRMAEPLRLSGRIIRAVVSKRDSSWFVSISVECADLVGPTGRDPIGIDLGVSTFVVLSSGGKIDHPMPLKHHLPRLRKLSKSVSRKRPGSSNHKKAKSKLSALYLKLSNKREDFLHKTSSDLVNRFGVIGVEDLDVQSMQSRKSLGRALIDLSFSKFRRQLEYKTKKKGKTLVVASRWFPSSKLCSDCGALAASMPLSLRSWSCVACGTEHDRDTNAAKNLEKYAVSSTDSACGGESSGFTDPSETKLSPMKQEEVTGRDPDRASERYNVQVPNSPEIHQFVKSTLNYSYRI